MSLDFTLEAAISEAIVSSSGQFRECPDCKKEVKIACHFQLDIIHCVAVFTCRHFIMYHQPDQLNRTEDDYKAYQDYFRQLLHDHRIVKVGYWT